MRALRNAAPVALVIAWFLFLNKRAFAEQFNSDDITNLVVPFVRGFEWAIHGSVLFWTGAIRPLGGLFYLTIYQIAGYHALPFRLAAIFFLVLNLVLLYAVLRRIHPSAAFAVLALVLACYNGDLIDMYMSTGTIYDTLCLTFVLLALLCQSCEKPRWLLAALCAIAAVDAKEMGVSIPALLLAYELILRRTRLRDWHRFTAIAATAIVSLAFLLSRLAVPNELSNHPAYKLTITADRYLETTRVYFNDLVFHGAFTNVTAIALLLGALALALVLRNRIMVFGWVFYMVALLPMSFATPRAGYAIYVPYAGAAIFGAALLIHLRDRVAGRWPYLGPAVTALAVCLAAANQYGQAHYLEQNDLGHAGGQGTVNLVANGVAQFAPAMPKGAHLLLINDPFENDEELPHSVLRLRYHDRQLAITRLAWKRESGTLRYPPENYDHVFLFGSENVWELPREASAGAIAGQPPSFTAMNSKDAELCIVKDIGGRDASPRRWVYQDPELLFTVPAYPSHFEMTYTVPGVILEQVHPLEIEIAIAGQPAPSIVVSKEQTDTYHAALPANLKPGEVASVRLHIRKPYISKTDGTRLSFLLTSAGFVKN